MLSRLVTASLRHRVLIVLATLAVAAYGLVVAQRSKLDVFPEFAPPRIVVQTEAQGLAAEQVEVLVTRPIEYALNGTPDLEAIYSQSIQGLSVVTLVFRDQADVLRVRQLTGERLALVGSSLPDGVQRPQMGPLVSSTSLTLVVGLVSKSRTAMDVRSFADWNVRPRLLAVPGVARVETFGGDVRQLQVLVRPDHLNAFGLGIDDVVQAAKLATGVRGAGMIDTGNQRITVRTEAQSLTPEALATATVIGHHGGVATLGDVARVVNGAQIPIGAGLVNGNPGVVLLVHSQYGANTLDVTRRLEAAIAQMKPELAAEQLLLVPKLFRPASFIEASLKNINTSLLIGGILVIVVLLAFLHSVRAALVAFVTIPLSLLAAVIVLDAFAASLNTITLGGFAIAIGVVVDDAIIGLENVWRRLREQRSGVEEASLLRIVHDATLEVRGPIVYATLVVGVVFWPVLMMSGVNGRLFAPLAIAFLLATLASLIVAVTLTPALCYLLLRRAPLQEPRYIAVLRDLHRRLLVRIASRPRTILASTAGFCLVTAAVLPFLGGEFLPVFKEGHFIVRMSMVPGSSLQTSLDLGKTISGALLSSKIVRSVSQEVGRAEQGEDTNDTEASEFHVDLRSTDDSDRGSALVRSVMDGIPGVNYSVTPFLGERIEEVMSGARGAVIVRVSGTDLDEIDRGTEQVRQIVASVQGAANVYVPPQSGSPEIRVTLRPDQLRRFGFKSLAVLEAIQAAYQGTTVAQTYDGIRVSDVTVILDSSVRSDPSAVGKLWIRNEAGMRLPLGELARVDFASGRYLIERENTVRRRVVSCSVVGRDLVSFVHDLKVRLANELHLPPSVSWSIGGAAEAQATAVRQIAIHSLVAAVAIILILSLALANVKNVALVLANLPFALAGGVLGVLVTASSLSIGSIVGFISLFGISTRNSILLVSHYEHLVTQEGLPWTLDTAIRGAGERLVPILMTALVVAFGLLPLAIASNEAGKEIEGPMAVVILGGLATSTVLNLLILPTLALRYGRFSRPVTPSYSTVQPKDS